MLLWVKHQNHQSSDGKGHTQKRLMCHRGKGNSCPSVLIMGPPPLVWLPAEALRPLSRHQLQAMAQIKHITLVIWEMQIKSARRHHLPPIRMAISKKTRAGEDAEKLEALCTVGTINWYNCYGKQDGGSVKNEKEGHPGGSVSGTCNS